MSSLHARTGRTRQRYKDTFRLVAGCIPYKFERSISQHKLLVLMVSSPNRDDFVFPKGGWENDEDVGEAACREALEEAGVKGNLDLTINEAFGLCRYSWMQEALHKFLTTVLGDGTMDMKDMRVVLDAGQSIIRRQLAWLICLVVSYKLKNLPKTVWSRLDMSP